MKSFRFRLQSLLHFRESQEIQCRQELTRLEAQERACQDHIKDLNQRQQELLSLAGRQPLSLVRLQAHEEYQDWLQECLKQQHQMLAELSQKHMRLKGKLESILKGKQTLENYKDHLKQRHQHFARKMQGKFLDSLAARPRNRFMED